MLLRDDLGATVSLDRPASRIVSLVPSLTEALALTARDRLVGATDWCTHPADLDITRLRGTKNPDLGAISRLEPDLVVANKEENRRLDVDRMRAAGLAVWVTDIESVDQSLASMRRLFEEALDLAAPPWLRRAEQVWAEPAPSTGLRAVVPIWRDPWMVVGSRTFTGDLLERLGVGNAFGADAERYPHVELTEIDSARPDLVILPDEPYVFTVADGPECFAPGTAVLVSGRLLTWYGPSLTIARTELTRALDLARRPPTAGGRS